MCLYYSSCADEIPEREDRVCATTALNINDKRISVSVSESLLLNFHYWGLGWFLRSGRLVAEGGGRFWPMGSQGALWRHCPRSSLVETSLLQVGLWALPLHPPLRPRLALFIAPTTTYWFQHQRNGLKPDKTSNDIETKCRHLISDFYPPPLLLCPYYFHFHSLKGKLGIFFSGPKFLLALKVSTGNFHIIDGFTQ